MRGEGGGRKPGYRHDEATKRKIAKTWAERNRLTELGRIAEPTLAQLEQVAKKEGSK